MDSRARSRGGPAVCLRGKPPRLFLVTNEAVAARPSFLDSATEALAAGGWGCALQLRAHGLRGSQFVELGARLQRVASSVGASLWINDRLDVALAVRSHGVQLGARSVSPVAARRLLGRATWIGCSVHSADEALAAPSECDLAVLGSVFETSSHPGRAPLGLQTLQAAAASRRPIVAIGGITPERVKAVVEAGAWGVAVLSGVWESGDPRAEVLRYQTAIQRALGFGGSERRQDSRHE